MARSITRNLNKIIDVNHYPVETARRSNMRHRPIGLGVQGLADAFLLLGLPFDCEKVWTLIILLTKAPHSRSESSGQAGRLAGWLACLLLRLASSALVSHDWWPR